MSQPAVSDDILVVENLRTEFATDDGLVPAVSGVSFTVGRGRTVALVGESGSGKSVTGYSILRLIQPPGKITGGRILLQSSRLGPIDITALGEKDPLLFKLRGGLVSMIFQEPMTALSPVHTVGAQICESILLHLSFSTRQKNIKIHSQIDNIELSLQDALPFSLLLNELITNSYKHAFNGKDSGNIYISFIKKQGEFVFHFRDDGNGFDYSNDVKEKTLGLNLIEAFSKQLKGKLEYNSAKGMGTEIKLHFKS